MNDSAPDPGPPPRLLVTGFRYWKNRDVIQTALYHAWTDLGSRPDTVLVQGECPFGGADRIAKEIWEMWGFPVESVPAEYSPTGQLLGPKRNAEMVRRGADLCLAFPAPESRGTQNCMRLAREAGIPVRTYLDERTTK